MCIRVSGRRTILHRAGDEQGQAVDFLLSERRDMAAAKEFFIQATK
jgi:putative transposase